MKYKIGWGANMINWIMWCVTTATISVLVNGVPCEPFKIERGLSQGDPISFFF